jgi:hypothetical protein
MNAAEPFRLTSLNTKTRIVDPKDEIAILGAPKLRLCKSPLALITAISRNYDLDSSKYTLDVVIQLKCGWHFTKYIDSQSKLGGQTPRPLSFNWLAIHLVVSAQL